MQIAHNVHFKNFINIKSFQKRKIVDNFFKNKFPALFFKASSNIGQEFAPE